VTKRETLHDAKLMRRYECAGHSDLNKSLLVTALSTIPTASTVGILVAGFHSFLEMAV